MTIKDITKMSHKELDMYESELFDLYEDKFGESYPLNFFRPDTDVVCKDIIEYLKSGIPKARIEYPPDVTI